MSVTQRSLKFLAKIIYVQGMYYYKFGQNILLLFLLKGKADYL